MILVQTKAMDDALPLLLIGGLGSAMFFSVAIVVLVLVLKNNTSETKPSPSGDESGDRTDVTAPEVPSGDFKPTAITFFGQGGPNSKADDNGVGFSGVDLFKYTGVTFNGQPVFAGAVHHDHASKHMYDVLEVTCDKFTSPNKKVLIHVVDICNRNDKQCANVDKYGFLVDIHWTAFSYVGLDDGNFEGRYKVIGHIPPSKLPARVWMQKVLDKKDSILCYCTGECKEKDQKWTLLDTCKTTTTSS